MGVDRYIASTTGGWIIYIVTQGRTGLRVRVVSTVEVPTKGGVGEPDRIARARELGL